MDDLTSTDDFVMAQAGIEPYSSIWGFNKDKSTITSLDERKNGFIFRGKTLLKLLFYIFCLAILLPIFVPF